jgi:3D (Asp-Asp-Asp) domain-containing protein
VCQKCCKVHPFVVTIGFPVVPSCGLRAPTLTVGRAALTLCALLLLVLPATSGADQIGRLRAAQTELTAREHTAVLQLYSLDTSLDRARGELATLERRLASARRDQAVAQHQLRIARASLAVARSRLDRQLRTLYEYDSPDALAVVLGAASLDDVITGLDSLDRVTASTSRVVAQTRKARAAVARVLASLDARTSSLDRLRAGAAERTAALERARSARAAYVESLRTQQQLTAGRIASLESRARAAEAASTVATVKAQTASSLGSLAQGGNPPATTAAPAAPSAAAAAPAPVQPASGSGKQLTVVATAYSLHGGTASGLPTGPGVVAVDPTVIPLGTRMLIPGYGAGIAADTGTAIKGLRIDLWFPTLSQAQHWGRRTVTITLR